MAQSGVEVEEDEEEEEEGEEKEINPGFITIVP